MSNILKRFENGEDPCWLLLEDDDWSEVSSLGSDCSWGSSESESDEEASTLSESMSSLSDLSDHNNKDNNVDDDLPLMGQLRLRRRPCIERSLSSKSRWDSGSKAGGSQCWSTKLPAPDRKSRRQSRQSKKIMTSDNEEHEGDEAALCCSKKRQVSLLTLPPRLGRLQRQSLRSIYSNGGKPKDHDDDDDDGEQRPLTRRSQTLEDFSPATRTRPTNAKSFHQGGTRDGPDLRRRQTIAGSTSRSRSSMSLQQWQLLNRPQDILKKKHQASCNSRLQQQLDLSNTRRVIKTASSSSGSQVAPRRSVTLETILPSAAAGQAAMQQGVLPALRRCKTNDTPLKEWQGRRMRRQMAELPVTVQVESTTNTKPLSSSRGNVSTTVSSNPSSVSSLPVRGLIRVGPPRLSNSTRSLNKLLVRNRTIERKPSSGSLREATQERIRQSLLSTSCASTAMKNAAWPTEQQRKSPGSKGTVKLGIETKARLRKTLSMPQKRTNKSSSSSDNKNSSSSKKSLRKTQSLQEEDAEQRPTTKSMQDTLRETLSLALTEFDNVPMTRTTPATPSCRNQRQPLGRGQPLEVVVPPNKVISVIPAKQKPSPTRVKMLNDDDDDARDNSAISGSTRSFPPCSVSSGEDSLVPSPSVICKNVAWMPHEKQPSSTATTTTASRLVGRRIPVRQPPLLAALRDDFMNHAAAAASATTRSGGSRGCAA